ncbi:endonuclease [Sphingobacterium sp. DK4209]|uniref:Endonuclease n=1 Tax=Sphingobacterium zhuxiongii TaxID=2662364 RepID=A0A5Q0QBF4_9SPHI|nr:MULTISPECIES: endonuclease/exonuclease/phosphatase family protein [unclassified Sphingobacterium]MVZ66634.1 endonuclease [Sphingobacterium sp. DK4209]QGA26816.1 endonuclease [Sphingobacterium sp. dk4302]
MEITLYILGSLILICSLLPLIRHDYWTFRVFEYPRIQKLAIAILWLLLYMLFVVSASLWLNLMAVAIGITAICLLIQIIPFTPLAKKQVFGTKETDKSNSLSILISNVFEDNDDYQGCVDVVKKSNADLVLLLETNHRWEKETAVLDQDYPHQIKVPIDNTYGMLMFSKLPFRDSEVKYLVEEEIPSIHTKIELPSGQLVQVFAVHPTPPVPNENPRSTERDKELLLVADQAKNCKLPVVVIGDLNDVAWSYTTELFLKMSELLDPRRGRGFFNTFHAKYPLMQFPLDHAFISAHFKLISLRKMNNFNSDHYPIFVHLQYASQNESIQEDNQLEASQADKEIAAEKKTADTSD